MRKYRLYYKLNQGIFLQTGHYKRHIFHFFNYIK